MKKLIVLLVLGILVLGGLAYAVKGSPFLYVNEPFSTKLQTKANGLATCPGIDRPRLPH